MNKYIGLLQKLIATPSFSREEQGTASILYDFLQENGVAEVHRKYHNVWCYNRFYDSGKPTILLNSHHDTVKPTAFWTRDPFVPELTDGTLYGLGSNDAGASVVSLVATFLHFYDQPELKYNLCLALTAEEEISGKNGIESILPELGTLDFAIVGEPTGMQMAVAERGLLVLDCVAKGKAGHAARDEGENAIYKAIKDIEWFRTYRFPEESPLFGPVKMSVTMIEAGSQHNVVPAECRFTVDIRTIDKYTNEQILDTIRASVESEVLPRSMRLKPSSIASDHPIVLAGKALGKETFGSPTMSDQALLDIPSLKIGPGDSARSHSADEFIELEEVETAIGQYVEMIGAVCG